MEKQNLFKKFIYSQKTAPYVFLLPFAISFLVFFAYSIFDTFVMSFQRVAGGNTEFIGLKNYQVLFNPIFFKALKNSIFYMIVTCCIMIPFPMLLATALNSKSMRCKNMYRSLLFIPALLKFLISMRSPSVRRQQNPSSQKSASITYCWDLSNLKSTS